ncbi:MAG: hypothetical protein QOD86_1681 [Miltoncostaeaceae bacterium]|jgi:hypothetical protein|nr:hypothetical protein [Miltoncostaeaceae bacterium]
MARARAQPRIAAPGREPSDKVFTRPAQPPPAPPAPPAAGDLVRFVEPAGKRRNRVGTVERQIAKGRHRGALVIRVAGEARRYVLPADRLRSMGSAPAAAPPPPAPPRARRPEPPSAPAPAARPAIAGEPLRLFD